MTDEDKVVPLLGKPAEPVTLQPPTMVSLTWQAIYSDGSMRLGSAVPNGEGPFEMQIVNARGGMT